MSWFIENFKKFDKKIAIVFKNQNYSYGDLYNQIKNIENELLPAIEKGKVVSILSDYSFESIALLIALYKNKNISISIISWDDDIDFAYSELDNKDPGKAKVVKIKKAQEEMNDSVFNEIDSNYFYRCNEKDHTNLSKAIEASIKILDNNTENFYHRTSKFIILVTGASEYDGCDNRLIELAREKGYPVFVISMDLLDKKSNMFRDLENLSDNVSSIDSITS